VEAGFEVIVAGEALLRRELLAGVTAAENTISSMATTAEQFLPQRNPRREGELHGSE
jgi:hypothetical protein